MKEYTKNSQNNQVIYTKTHISCMEMDGDYCVGGGILVQQCGGSQKLEGGKQEDRQGVINKRTKRWCN